MIYKQKRKFWEKNKIKFVPKKNILFVYHVLYHLCQIKPDEKDIKTKSPRHNCRGLLILAEPFGYTESAVFN
jgi:hypothetical protein